MKDKNAAGILALFLGWMGFHRFYLGQTGLGVVYLIFCWFPLIWIVAFVDAISLFAMDQARFDQKYNSPHTDRRDTDFERRPRERERYRDERREYRQEHRKENRVPVQRSQPAKPNPFKNSGLEKFKDYDYPGAIEDFKKSLDLAPTDIATHFNLACAYSLVEDAANAFSHLDKAVQLGFRDFQKIKEHHALAYLRIQKEFDAFEDNGFRLPQASGPAQPAADLLNSQPDLLDQLTKLGELREKGLLTEREFDEQKKKLLG
ncbi:MAG: NINE protein [Saprospiraceae bacterium]